MLQKVRIRAGAGKSSAAHVLILDGTMLVRVTNPELVAVGKVVEDAAGAEEVMCGIGNGLRDGTDPRPFRSSEGSGIDDALLVVEIFVECEQEAGPLAVANRPGNGAFVVLAALGGLHNREGIGSIEDGVTE